MSDSEESERDRLREDIVESLVKSGFDNEQRFLPERLVAELTAEKRIRKLFPNAPKELIDFICKGARRIFLNIVFSTQWPEKKMLKIVEKFRKHKITDQQLPIDDIASNGNCKKLSKDPTPACKHSSALDIFHEWRRSDVREFCQNQQQFNSPVFKKKDRLGKEFPMGCILPFTEVKYNVKHGHFSSVHEAKLRADHQDHFKLICPPNEPNFKTESAWGSEVRALDGISDICHQHLIDRIAAFKRDQKYFILFEWADSGTLRDVWKNNSKIHLQLSGTHIEWFLKQMLGLVGALGELHKTKSQKKPPITESDESQETSGQQNDAGIPIIITNADGGDSSTKSTNSAPHWRHGDLKPDNILAFSQSKKIWLSTLKIADLGLAKQHEYETSNRVEPTGTTHSTLHYEAPEVITQPDEPRSRRYDVWSMGCIIFESVIWLLYGYDTLNAFLKKSMGNTNQTPYFTTQGQLGGTAEINKLVKSLINQILEKDPECSESPSTAIGDLLRLVRDKLLVVALPPRSSNSSEKPNAQHRTNARGLESEMLRICDKARNEKAYLIQEANSQQLDDIWEFLIDNHFALDFFRFPGVDPLHNTAQPVSRKCERCRELNFLTSNLHIRDAISGLKERSTTCDFCGLLLTAYTLGPSQQMHSRYEVEFHGVRSGLKMNDGATRVLSICETPTNKSVTSSTFGNIQIGFPVLPEIESATFYELLRRWLQDCDNHQSCSHENTTTGPRRNPTRLIDVGEVASEKIYLSDVNRCGHSYQERLRYIALSHPWGDKERHNHFSTTRKNIDNRVGEGFAFSELPSTFKDAVKVTRELGVQYLWIDSICIIQSKDGDDGDFKDEAEHMEEVFSFAYCVIAASRAEGTSSGFLGKRRSRKFVEFETFSGTNLYVCEAIEDFQRDVIDGALNKRGWVLQERALARRTIYFTETQVYWECGEGIRCETLTKMRNNKAAFLGDPAFPKIATNSTKGGQIRLYESLYRQYSTLQFTNAYDRPIAIAGLEQRLIRAFGKPGGFGIFERYFGRSLLWQRDSNPMKDIQFPSQQYRQPTWSWMAYEGGITFMDVPFDGVQWDDSQILSPWSRSSTSSSSWHTGDSKSRILEGTAREINLAQALKHIVFDKMIPHHDGALRCIVVGSQKPEIAPNVATRKHYVLVITKRFDIADYTTYERVGVGTLLGSWIALDGLGSNVMVH
ncbi:hypothetical protein BKA56DRAFT_632063 [Ilyonectria sp. MPI-CAGE-AT-0026]|nr:hypothetical protein BKA56DRAFT_632063 [Ilyonectria sp. MPI-CAGE-AT-0026]